MPARTKKRERTSLFSGLSYPPFPRGEGKKFEASICSPCFDLIIIGINSGMRVSIFTICCLLHILTVAQAFCPRYKGPFPRQSKLDASFCFKMAVDYTNQAMLRRSVESADLILAVPTTDYNMQEITLLRKNLPSRVAPEVISRANIIAAIDGTPFCTMAVEIESSNILYSIADKSMAPQTLESCLKWSRQISKDRKKISQIIIARRAGHMLKVNIGPDC